MKKKIFGLLSVAMLCAVSAFAHPLGNFSINQYSRLEVETSNIKIRSVLDLAEIPTFQAKSEIDTNKDGAYSEAELNAYAEKITPEYLANLFLTVDNKPLELREVSKTVSLKEGAGNLPTLTVKWDLTADFAATDAVGKINFENKNYVDRLGWDEMVVNRTSGVNVFDSTAYGSGITDELKSYPEESLNAPLAERTAEFSVTTGAVPANAKPLENRDGHRTAAIVEKDQLSKLIDLELTPTIIAFALLLAFGLGAMHAMSPGHGKAVVGAYLVGSKGTPKHAVFLGLTVTITHTLGVFALGLITLFASSYILPETLMPFLGFVSGLLVFFIGATMFKERLFTALGWQNASHHAHDHAHDHSHSHDGHTHSHDDGHHHHHHDDHDHDHNHLHDGLTHTHGGSTHTHLPPENVTWKSLLALGISGGLLPCPSALVLMLAAISAGKIAFGLVLTIFFSFGLAATLTAVGLVFLYVGKAFGGSKLADSRIIKALPVFSSFVIACIGAVICYTSFVN